VELGLVEQRLKAVNEVLGGATVTMRNGVTRQTVHTWLRRYARSGMASLVDKTSRPESCPHQMTRWSKRLVVCKALKSLDAEGDYAAITDARQDRPNAGIFQKLKGFSV